jgi:AraC-like DNA-binding protein
MTKFPTSQLAELVQNSPEAALMVVNLRPPGPTPLYQVGDLWSLNLYDQEGTVTFPDLDLIVQLHSGTVCLMPPGIRRSFCFETKGLQRVVHFRFVPPALDTAAAPLTLHTGTAAAPLMKLFDEAHAFHPVQRCRADALLWNLLWQLTDLTGAEANQPCEPSLPPELSAATAHIEQHLAEPLTVQAIVEHTGRSHTHLARLFHQHYKQNIVGYVRARRMTLARHLLQETDMPIKEIAWEVGLPDLQFFNKTVRRTFGMPPRQLRKTLPDTIRKHQTSLTL